MTSHNERVGQTGEDLAARHLEGLGYQIIERNFRCSLGEIDLVALHTEYVVFVEVKTNSARNPVHPSLRVDAKKQKQVRKLGEFYLLQHLSEQPLRQPRFDVVTVRLNPQGALVEHLKNAF